jgi:hypothetical protein
LREKRVFGNKEVRRIFGHRPTRERERERVAERWRKLYNE